MRKVDCFFAKILNLEIFFIILKHLWTVPQVSNAFKNTRNRPQTFNQAKKRQFQMKEKPLARMEARTEAPWKGQIQSISFLSKYVKQSKKRQSFPSSQQSKSPSRQPKRIKIPKIIQVSKSFTSQPEKSTQ